MPPSPIEAPDAVVEARGLGKHFDGRPALEDLDLVARSGRALGYLGPNGSGKTTTVRLLTGLLRPTTGTVDLFGVRLDRDNASALRQRIGVQADVSLYETLTVTENLRLWADLHGMEPFRRRTRTDAVLEVLAISDRRDTRVGALSKGTRQKVAIARALLHEPALLVLDEPTVGLDPGATAGFIEHLAELKRRGDTTIIVCTHQLRGLEALCDDLAVVRDGRLVAAGSVEDLRATTWPHHEVRVTIDDPRAAVTALGQIHGLQTTLEGETVVLTSPPERVPDAVAALVHAGLAVRAVVPVERSIHELYFRLLANDAP